MLTLFDLTHGAIRYDDILEWDLEDLADWLDDAFDHRRGIAAAMNKAAGG